MTPKYRADIDGLRAVAVLSVLLFHAGVGLFSGGYVGVDVFFVISGYLITTIIVREIDSGSFSVAHFYVRRCRRILPALLVMVVVCMVAGALLLDPGSFREFGKSVVATALFASNVLFYLLSGYFDGPAELKPLLHTWSLAVEEQYYIFFPWLLVLIAGVAGRHYARWLLLVAVLSLAASVWVTQADAPAAFYLIHTRAWELFAGSLLAIGIAPAPRTRHYRELLALSGLLMIGASVIGFSAQTAFPGYHALLPVLGAALVIYAGTGGRTLTAGLLGSRPMVFFGLISYSLYLWHWPVIVFTRRYTITELTAFQVALIMCVSVMLATLSWKYVEKPFRKSGPVRQDRRVLSVSAACLAAAACCGMVVKVNDGYANRYSHALVRALDVDDPEWEHWAMCERQRTPVGSPDGLCEIGRRTGRPGFIYWGDSHARALASAVDLSAARVGVTG